MLVAPHLVNPLSTMKISIIFFYPSTSHPSVHPSIQISFYSGSTSLCQFCVRPLGYRETYITALSIAGLSKEGGKRCVHVYLCRTEKAWDREQHRAANTWEGVARSAERGLRAGWGLGVFTEKTLSFEQMSISLLPGEERGRRGGRA